MGRKRSIYKRGDIFVLGVTGSVAMGKSTVARMFARLGAAVCDSDLIVHKLLGPRGGAVERVERLFPGMRGEHGIDRKALGREVFADPQKLALLESVLHPLVRQGQQAFIRKARRQGARIVLLDIPLLFETQAEARCHRVAVVSAPAFIQRQRALARPGMTAEKLARILARQWKDGHKRSLADDVILTGAGRHASWLQVLGVMRKIRSQMRGGAGNIQP